MSSKIVRGFDLYSQFSIQTISTISFSFQVILTNAFLSLFMKQYKQIASLNDKYEVPKDFVNRKPLNSYMTPKNQRAQKFGAKYAAQNGGVHIATLVSIILSFSYKSQALNVSSCSNSIRKSVQYFLNTYYGTLPKFVLI